MVVQGASDVRPRLSLPYPDQMPARRYRMREPTGAKGWRRLPCPRSGLLVQGFRHPSQAAETSGQTETAANTGAIAGRLPPGAGRARREAIAKAGAAAGRARAGLCLAKFSVGYRQL